MANKAELTGIERLLNQLRNKLNNASSRVENKALQAAGEPIAAAMRDKVNRSQIPYSYHLKDNIRVSRVQRRDGVKYVLIGPTKKSWLACSFFGVRDFEDARSTFRRKFLSRTERCCPPNAR